MRPPRPYTRKDKEDLIQLLYRFHCRAMEDEKYEVAKRAALLIGEIGRNTKSWGPMLPAK